ncbi:hypothetical protein [Lentzea nigeriaca]|nr:hypothetical protein [Lentzea nigeriaca]
MLPARPELRIVGRYLNTPGRTPEWITVAPADNNGLARRLGQVLSLRR